MRRLLFALAALLVPLVLAGPAPAAGPVTSVAAGCNNDDYHEVCFNDPTSSDVAVRGVIFTRLRQMIDLAGPGDEVRVAMYSWSAAGDGVARALARARGRGADVRVVVGSGATARPIRLMRAAGVEVAVCRTACISKQAGSISHVKLVLLRLSGRKHTILTSSNLTTPQRDRLYNNSVRAARDDALYDFYRAYWDRLRARDWQGWGDAERGTLTPGGSLALALPRTDGDPVAGVLADVEACPKGHAKIWLAIAIYTAKRPGVQQQLRRLHRLGCNVRLVIGNEVRTAVAGAGLPASKVRRAPVHHKFLVVDAQIRGAVRTIVLTGSQNLTDRALRANDEVWAGFSAPLVTAAYMLRFGQLYDQRARPAR